MTNRAPHQPRYTRRGIVVLVGRSRITGVTIVRWYSGEYAALTRGRALARASWRGADVTREAHPDTVDAALACADQLARRPWSGARGWATHRRTRGALVPVRG